MFRKNKKENKAKLEHKLYIARETPEPIFDLSDCDLSVVPQGIFSLCKVFLKEILLLGNNRLISLSGGGQLKDLQLLKILDIQNNAFSTLPEEISLLINLKELYANNNKLKELPATICNMVHLQILDISNNSIKRLPENIGNLISLKIFRICGNKNLKELPKTICRIRKLVTLELDVENVDYPPKLILEEGTQSILKYISRDSGFSYDSSENIEDSPIDEKSKSECYEHIDNFQAKIWELEKIKQQKIQEFLDIEKHNEMLQRQELELANVQKAHKEKLLDVISQQQKRFDSELSKIQIEKETERFRLIEQLQEAENKADITIKQLLALNSEPIAQLLEQEKEEENRLLTAINRYEDTLRKDDILSAMQEILKQETEKFNLFNQNRIDISRSILEQELETDTRLLQVLQDQDLQKANLLIQLQEDNDLQKVAVGTLLERGDARSWGLLQQVRLVESQLGALTRIEIDRKSLEMNQQLTDLAEKRLNLSVLLLELLEQQKERRNQLLTTLHSLEEHNDDNINDFWLKQYQRLLDKLPEGLSQAQKNIEPTLAQALLMRGVIHCLPFLAKLTQCNCDTKHISDSDLLEAGVANANDRIRILDAFHIYEKEKNMYSTEPSAPLLQVEEASAPLPDQFKSISTSECVICLDCECQIIFVPCGHLCCCSNCSLPVIECPLCRSTIERKIIKLLS